MSLSQSLRKENRGFNRKGVIRMKKEDFMSWLTDQQDALTPWTVAVDKEKLTDFVVGCFFANDSATWKVYINKERGEHRVRLETEDEEQAFNKLKRLVEYIIESNREYI